MSSGTMSVRATNEQWDELIEFFQQVRQTAEALGPEALLLVMRAEPKVVAFIRNERRERQELFG